MKAEAFSKDYGIPLSNIMLQQQAQQAQEGQFGASFGEQQRLNTFGMGQQAQAGRRDDIGLDYGIYSGDRAFGEGQRQFDTTTGLNYAQLNAQTGLGYAGLGSQEKIAQGQQQLGYAGLGSQEKIAGMGAQTTERGQDITARTAAERLGYDFSALSQQDKQYFANLSLESALGRGQLGVQQGQLGTQQAAESRLGRQQQFDESFRRDQMQQEYTMMQQQLANQMQQSKYSAFGRAQAPNFRQVASWR